MQRNKSLARELLEIIVEEDNGGGGLYRDEIHAVFAERYPSPVQGREEIVDYHLRLLVDAGLVRHTTGDPTAQDNFEMTWFGHDFAESV